MVHLTTEEQELLDKYNARVQLRLTDIPAAQANEPTTGVEYTRTEQDNEVTTTETMEIQVRIPHRVYAKVMYWIREAAKKGNEVGGMGKVSYEPTTGVFTIHEAYLLDQVVKSAETEIDHEALGRLMYETRKDKGDLNWWWHSHVRMAAFWSTTDTDTIKQLGSNGWLLATVFNVFEENRTALGYKLEHPFWPDSYEMMDELKFVITGMKDTAPSQWKTEFQSKVREVPKQPAYYSTYESPRWRGDKSDRLPYAMDYASSELVDHHGNTAEDRKDIYDAGLTGRGLRLESKFTMETSHGLYSALMTKSPEELMALEADIEDKIRVARERGELHKYMSESEIQDEMEEKHKLITNGVIKV